MFYACVAETFGHLSVPLRDFLGLCSQRIATQRRDAGSGEEASARIFECALTTRARVAALSCPLDPSLLTVTPLLSSTSLTSLFLFPYSYLS
ncbi:hypothetical protein CLOM_g6181 [Closterium sp. NIES-68]|nr:hypothetical protein CLOM_g3738 [Closterium sp. NIES-68]GJP46942.1 hypothetical protein CLOM_g6181 [Closterium sp. NIES-68]